jgi:diacylglycerol kinase
MNPDDKNSSCLKKRALSFQYAFNGIYNAIKTQTNIRIHLFAAAIVIFSGLYFRISTWEWFLVIISMGLVISAELFNSAIEALADHVASEKNERIGTIKDMAAGAVLICAIAAAIIGVLIFLPKIFHMITA